MKINKIKKLVLISLGVIIVGYVFICVLFFVFQQSLIYFPSDQDFASCARFSDAQKINLEGTRMYYQQVSDVLVIVYHGNGGSACDRSFLKSLLAEENVSYLFVEYAGYSSDKRTPNKERILNDVQNVHKFIRSLNMSKVIVLG